jgi:hypothetical protein
VRARKCGAASSRGKTSESSLNFNPGARAHILGDGKVDVL